MEEDWEEVGWVAVKVDLEEVVVKSSRLGWLEQQGSLMAVVAT